MYHVCFNSVFVKSVRRRVGRISSVVENDTALLRFRISLGAGLVVGFTRQDTIISGVIVVVIMMFFEIVITLREYVSMSF